MGITTLRKHTLVSIIFCFFCFSSFGQVPTTIAGFSDSGDPCIGDEMVFSLTFLFPSLTAYSFTDNNPFDGITAVETCLNCDGSLGGVGIYNLRVNLTSGTVGSTVNFLITLTDPDNFVDGTGEGTVISATQIVFVVSILVNEVPTVSIVPSTLELCDGDDGFISATISNGATGVNLYEWEADSGDASFNGGVNPGNSPVANVLAHDTYNLSVSNACGEGTATRMVTTNNTPNIQMNCMDNGNGTTTITADILNAATATTVRFFNNGNLHTTSNNNNGPGDDPSITVTNAIFNTQVFTINGENTCGNASISGSCLILPVELLYFRGKVVDNTVQLDWATATEINNDFFTVERSENGRDFQAIATIDGAGTSQQELQYSYEDKALLQSGSDNTLYYRLKQTDFDERFAYSEIIVLSVTSSLKFDISLSHFQDSYLKLGIINPQASPLSLQLFDFNGRLIRQIQLPAQYGKTELSLMVPELQAGFYVLKASNGSQSISRKIAKVE